MRARGLGARQLVADLGDAVGAEGSAARTGREAGEDRDEPVALRLGEPPETGIAPETGLAHVVRVDVGPAGVWSSVSAGVLAAAVVIRLESGVALHLAARSLVGGLQR